MGLFETEFFSLLSILRRYARPRSTWLHIVLVDSWCRGVEDSSPGPGSLRLSRSCPSWVHFSRPAPFGVVGEDGHFGLVIWTNLCLFWNNTQKTADNRTRRRLLWYNSILFHLLVLFNPCHLMRCAMMQQRYLFQDSVPPVHFCGHSFSKDDHQFLMLFSLSFVVKLKMYRASSTFVQYNNINIYISFF